MPIRLFARAHSEFNLSTEAGKDPIRTPYRPLPRAGLFAGLMAGAGLLAVLMLLAGCLGGGGSGSETTMAGITGKVVDTQGRPLEGATVRIRPEGALPSGRLGIGGKADDPVDAYTKADGTFLVEGMIAGDYYVECRATEGAALLQASVKDALVRLPDAMLLPTGAIRGRIGGLGVGSRELSGAFVSVQGMPGEIFLPRIFADTVGFTLDDIPAGIHAVTARPGYTSDLDYFKTLVLPSVRVESGDTTDLGFFGLPVREGMQDSAYLRDSAALAAVNGANGYSEGYMSILGGVTGNRITTLFACCGPDITRLTPDLAVLDQVDYLNLQAPHDSSEHILAGASEIAHLHKLRTLALLKYRLEGDLEWLRTLTNLEEISLGSAGLKAFPRQVEDLPFLHTLYLNIDSPAVVPASIGKMKQLRYLGLGASGLEDLPSGISELGNLRGLYLAHNAFTSFPRAVLALDGLRALDLSDNSIASLPREIMAMPALRGLNARGNRLCGVSQEWKDWLSYQDSLWYAQIDTSFTKLPRAVVDSGWEAGQRCGNP